LISKSNSSYLAESLELSADIQHVVDSCIQRFETVHTPGVDSWIQKVTFGPLTTVIVLLKPDMGVLDYFYLNKIRPLKG